MLSFLRPLFFLPLSSPWWGQPGHTVRLVPSLPLLTLFDPCTSLLLVTYRLPFLLVGFLPCFVSYLSILWPAWAYCPARHSSLSYVLSYPLSFRSSLFSSLSAFLPLFPSFQGVCPKRLRPTRQHLMTVRPKVVLSSHVVSLFALALPLIFSCLSYVPTMLLVPPMPLDAYATGYFTTLSLGTLLTTDCCARYTNDLCL